MTEFRIGDRFRVTKPGCNFPGIYISMHFASGERRKHEFVGGMGALMYDFTGTIEDTSVYGGEQICLISLDCKSGLYAISGDGIEKIPTEPEIEMDTGSLLGLIQN